MAVMPKATVTVKYQSSKADSHRLAFLVIDLIVNAVEAYVLTRIFPLEAYRTFVFWTVFIALSQTDRIVRALRAGGANAL